MISAKFLRWGALTDFRAAVLPDVIQLILPAFSASPLLNKDDVMVTGLSSNFPRILARGNVLKMNVSG